MIDFNTEQPKCYDVTRVDTVTMGYDGTAEPAYDGKGCILLVVTETEFNPDVDNVSLMLCDYVDPNSVPQPTTPINITYYGSPEIRVGGRKTFKAATENSVVFSLEYAAIWEGKLSLTQSDNQCVVVCENDSAMVGASFKVVATYNGQRSELRINIISAV